MSRDVVRSTIPDSAPSVIYSRVSAPGSYEALQESPSPDGMEALCAALAPGTRAANPRVLGGGIRCGVHALDLRRPNGKVRTIVLKRFPRDYLEQNPRAFDAERRALDIVAGTGAPTPRLLWVDRAGEAFGVPALAMAHLPGISLTRAMTTFDPRNTDWVRPIARALAQVHAAPPVPGDRDLLRSGDIAATWDGIADTLTVADWAVRGALPHGQEVARIVRERRPDPSSRPDTVLHGDFHPSNLLWNSGQLSGVIDWSEARIGAREYDLAHMRWELGLRLGPLVADEFLRQYQTLSGYRTTDMSLWDLLWIWRLAPALESWVWFFESEGQSITLDALQRRRDEWLEHILQNHRQSR